MDRRTPQFQARLLTFLRKVEKGEIIEALRRYRGHVSQTAIYLGISRPGLYLKMRDYGLLSDAADLRAEAGISGQRKAEQSEQGEI